MFNEYPDVLTAAQAAKALRVGIKTIYSLTRERKLGHLRIGNKIIIPKYSLIEFLRGENGLFLSGK